MTNNLEFIPLEDMIDEFVITPDDWKQAFEPTGAVTVLDAAALRIMTPMDGNMLGRVQAPFDQTRCPATKVPMQQLSNNHVRTVVVKAASQSGKTQIAINFLLWRIIVGSQMAVLVPTNKLATTVWRRYEMNINSTPVTREMKVPKRWSLQNGFHLAGSRILINSSNSYSSLISHSFDSVIFDEVATASESLFESGLLDAVKSRLKQYPRSSKLLMVSTPGNQHTVLEQGWNECELQVQYAIRCPECGEILIPDMDLVDFHKELWSFDSEGERVPAYDRRYVTELRKHATLVCKYCNHEITDRERGEALQNGVWVGAELTNGDADDFDGLEEIVIPENQREWESIGFSWTSLCAPEMPLSNFVSSFAKSRQSMRGRIAFQTEMLGRTFIIDENRVSARAKQASALREFESDVPREVLPSGTVGLIAGVDCQRNRFYGLKLAVVRDDSGVERFHIVDNVEVPRSGPGLKGFDRLVAWVDKEHAFEDTPDRVGYVSRCVIDSGGAAAEDMGEGDEEFTSTQLVREFCRHQNQTNRHTVFYPVFGRDTRMADTISQTKMYSGGQGSARVFNKFLISYNIKVLDIKLELNERLVNGEDGGVLEPFSFYAGTDEELFEHLVSEVYTTDKKGKRFFRKRHTRDRNDWLDCLVYSYASTFSKFDLGVEMVSKVFMKHVKAVKNSEEEPKTVHKLRDHDKTIGPNWIERSGLKNIRKTPWLKR